MPYGVEIGDVREFARRLKEVKREVEAIDPAAVPFNDEMQEHRRRLAQNAPNVGDEIDAASKTRRISGRKIALVYRVEDSDDQDLDGVAVILDVEPAAEPPIDFWVHSVN